jgi:hypothetical protein
MIRTLLAAFLMAWAGAAVAGGPEQFVLHQVAPAALSPDKAYLLLRSSTAKTGMMSIDHVLIRVPSEEEIEAYRKAKRLAYDAALPKLREKAKDKPVPTLEEFAFDYGGPGNMLITKSGKFIQDGEIRTYLIEVPAGDYIVYGIGVGGRALVTCNCLGTVRFTARPGVMTDLGTYYADKVHKESPLPYLEDNVGPSMFNYGWIMGQAVVPPTQDAPIPPALAGFNRVLADYRAVGLYHDPSAGSINRLAPIPGILAYDRGKVIDVRSGKAAD